MIFTTILYLLGMAICLFVIVAVTWQRAYWTGFERGINVGRDRTTERIKMQSRTKAHWQGRN